MKENYETPEMELVEFDTEDIITASSPSVETDLDPFGNN